MIFFTGFLIGIVSLIPGISGGTILVITKKYDEIAHAISHFKKKENFFKIFILLIGIILGTITFARIIEFLFYFFPDGIMIIFSSFILCHLPKLIKEENIKTKLSYILLGCGIIFLLSFFAQDVDKVVFTYPKFTISFLMYFAFCGAIDGFFTIIPGISGSMIMMLLGPYFLYKSFLANLTFSNMILLVPLFFYFIGDLFGFFIGSKFSIYVIHKHRQVFYNIIFGMIFTSALLLLPIPTFTLINLFYYILYFFIGYLLYYFLQLFF